MGYRLYILSIRDLLDEKVRKTAITYLDSHRLTLVNKYKKEQDRLRAIAAGLLLQVGFLELEFGDRVGAGAMVSRRADADDKSPEVARLEVADVMNALQDYASKHAISLPLSLSYKYGTHGKPAWERRCIDQFWNIKDRVNGAGKGVLPELDKGKKFPHFNLSHSGDYVVLAISDTPIGVDIQMERACDYPGGYKAFSRMEAYVKCTGEGIAYGRRAYEDACGKLDGYMTFEIAFVDVFSYNIVVCKKFRNKYVDEK